jgi:hypothetical protein
MPFMRLLETVIKLGCQDELPSSTTASAPFKRQLPCPCVQVLEPPNFAPCHWGPRMCSGQAQILREGTVEPQPGRRKATAQGPLFDRLGAKVATVAEPGPTSYQGPAWLVHVNGSSIQ